MVNIIVEITFGLHRKRTPKIQNVLDFAFKVRIVEGSEHVCNKIN